MADQTINTTPGGNPNNLENPPVGSDQVKALMAFGCPSDSGEGTFSKTIMDTWQKAINNETNSDETESKKDTLEVPKDIRSRSDSVASSAGKASSQSETASTKRKRSILDVGEPGGPEINLYTQAEEIRHILHAFELRTRKRPCAEKLDEVPERLQAIRRLVNGLSARVQVPCPL
ncbi:unnamed protein product [Trichogramma brassicae]|uniref:Uncharacterized protein n=1 Tax=Trichogramma brassicae TaxID=86971 RepID=A0A6H5ICP0_9HYME|nr:unnamed protein product [Trichogramma brassicae]